MSLSKAGGSSFISRAVYFRLILIWGVVAAALAMAAVQPVLARGSGVFSAIEDNTLDGMWTSSYRWYNGHIAVRGLVYSESGNLFPEPIVHNEPGTVIGTIPLPAPVGDVLLILYLLFHFGALCKKSHKTCEKVLTRAGRAAKYTPVVPKWRNW